MDNSLQRRLPQELELSVYEVARKEIVLKQDTYCNHLYVLLKGELEVNIVDVAGNLVKVEDIRAPRAFATPHLFGDKNLLPATFTASEDSVLLMATRTSVFKLISSVPDLLHRFLCVTGNCNKCTVTRLIRCCAAVWSIILWSIRFLRIQPCWSTIRFNWQNIWE